MDDSRYIIIVGCGRLGGILANQLSSEGHQIVVVDQKERAFEKLSGDFSGYKVLGDATEQSVLKQVGIERADFLFATTTEDNVNLMVAQVAKKIYGVPRVIARIFDPAREKIFHDMGMDTISPTYLTALEFMKIVHSAKE